MDKNQYSASWEVRPDAARAEVVCLCGDIFFDLQAFAQHLSMIHDIRPYGIADSQSAQRDASLAAQDEKAERVFQAVVYAFEGREIQEDLRDHGMVRRALKFRAGEQARLAAADEDGPLFRRDLARLLGLDDDASYDAIHAEVKEHMVIAAGLRAKEVLFRKSGDARLAAIVQAEREGARGGWAWLAQPDDGPLPHGLAEYRAMLTGAYKTIDRLLDQLTTRREEKEISMDSLPQQIVCAAVNPLEKASCMLPVGHDGPHYGHGPTWTWDDAGTFCQTVPPSDKPPLAALQSEEPK